MTEQLLDTSLSDDALPLTQIRGIGTIKKRWLSAIGIHTVHDLARVSANDLEQRFKAASRTISRSDIEAWIAQAHAAVDNPPVKEDAIAWQSLAAFAIEVQTRQIVDRIEQRTVIRPINADAADAWTDIELDQLHPWIRSHLPTTEPACNTPITIAIPQVRLLPSAPQLPMQVDAAHRLFSGSLQAGELFALEISLKFAGDAIAQLEQLTYQVGCSARHLSTGAVLSLGELNANVPYADSASYTARLPDLLLPQPGSYRLHVQVSLLNAAAVPGCFKVPLLKVM